MKRVSWTKVMAAGMVALFALAPAVQAQTALKASHSARADEPYGKALEEFANILKDKTGGKFALQVFPNSQLGQERDVIEGILLGTVDLACPANAVLTNFVPRLVLFDMPFVFRDRAHMYKVLDGPVGDALGDAARERGFRVLGYYEAGVRHIMTRGKPINSLEDLKGLKIRTMQNQAHLEAFKAFGANATALAYGELYGALQSGVMDGAEAANTNYEAQKFYEVAPNWAMVGWTTLVSPLIMSERKFQSMPQDVRNVLIEAGRASTNLERKLYAAGEDERLAMVKAKGVRVTTPDPKPFQAASKSVYDQFIKTPEDQKLLKMAIETN